MNVNRDEKQTWIKDSRSNKKPGWCSGGDFRHGDWGRHFWKTGTSVRKEPNSERRTGMRLVCLGNEKKPTVAGALEKGMRIHSSILAWRITWTEEPGGWESMGSQKVGHGWETNMWLKHRGEGEARVHRRLEVGTCLLHMGLWISLWISRKPLEGFKQGSDMIWLMFLKVHAGCTVENKFWVSKTGYRKPAEYGLQ